MPLAFEGVGPPSGRNILRILFCQVSISIPRLMSDNPTVVSQAIESVTLATYSTPFSFSIFFKLEPSWAKVRCTSSRALGL